MLLVAGLNLVSFGQKSNFLICFLCGCVEFDEKHITKDKRVVINGIKINDIDLDFFAFDEEETFKYESTDGTVEEFGFYATKLSWNGRTTLKFTTPVYLWILENI